MLRGIEAKAHLMVGVGLELSSHRNGVDIYSGEVEASSLQ